jgi:alkylhydroperoxidase family enzyme
MARAALGEALTQSIFDDYTTANISDGLRAAIALCVTLTRETRAPVAEVAALRAHGATDKQINEVIHICGAFNMIVRIADTLDFEVPDVSAGSGYGEAALKRGYT